MNHEKVEITGQLFKDIIDYVNQDYDYDRKYDDVLKIVEEVYDSGFCDTCSFPEVGLMIYEKEKDLSGMNFKQFVTIQVSDILEWVSQGRPRLSYNWHDENYPEFFMSIKDTKLMSDYPTLNNVTIDRDRHNLHNRDEFSIEIIWEENGDDKYKILYKNDPDYYNYLEVLEPFFNDYVYKSA